MSLYAYGFSERLDEGDEEGDGGVGVEAMASLEVGGVAVVRKIFVFAVDYIVVCAEKCIYQVYGIVVLAHYPEFRVELAGL